MDVRPLNPALYRRLCEVFGEVKIANEGVACTVLANPITGQSKMLIGGEYYRVNCPFCAMRNMHDLRQRLWIHHRWGIGPPDILGYETPRDDFRWAAYCFNSECLKQGPSRRGQLLSMIYSEGNHYRRRKATEIRGGRQHDTSLSAVPTPGACIRLDQLPLQHYAVQYMVNRGFDPVKLGIEYGVKYCEECHGENWLATGRLIFPVIMNSQQVTWQGRYIGDLDWQATGIPKYYTCKFSHKNLCLYNFDKARQARFVIVVEGPTDAIAVGPNSVAIMGKALSDPQYCYLAKYWDVIVLCIDGEAYEESEEMYRRLIQVKPVVRVQLPHKMDPAQMIHEDKDYFFQLVDGTCRMAGYDLLKLVP